MRRFLSSFGSWWPVLFFILAAWLLSSVGTAEDQKPMKSDRVKVTFSGGHETNPVDRGRPVVLVAGALGVTPEVFRDAFKNVRPASGGREPEPNQVRQNKSVLMKALSPHGVTNDRLDTVSNYYRIRPGEMWPTQPAEAFAIIKNGEISGFEVTKGGSGYSSPPKMSVQGYQLPATTVELSFAKDFEKNGAVSGIVIGKNEAAKR